MVQMIAAAYGACQNGHAKVQWSMATASNAIRTNASSL